MRIKLSFARIFTLAAIDGVAEYYDTVESGLQIAKVEDQERILAKIRGMKLEREDETAKWDEWDLAGQEHQMTFDMLLPNYFHYSYIVLLFLVVEDKLREMCKAAQSMGDLPAPPTPKQDPIGEYKEYLTKTAGIVSLNWEAIHDLAKIRNCIVHTSGKVGASRDKKRLQELAAKRELGISISVKHADFGEHLPLYLEDDRLVLEPKYCRRVTMAVRDFFEGLCAALVLPETTIEA